MQVKKMTVRVRKDLLEKAKRYARENDTTLTKLVTSYFEQLTLESDPLINAPTVWRLAGSLDPTATVDDYRQYLAEKYE